MSGKEHTYRVTVEWTGNRGQGTPNYAGYGRDHRITAGTKPPIAGSSDPAFLGDPAAWNPEDLLLGSIAACHKLWYLHLCGAAGISVTRYVDNAEATMTEDASGAGRFTRAVLRPVVVIARGCDADAAVQMHHRAHAFCFIANSVNFPITCEPAVTTE